MTRTLLLSMRAGHVMAGCLRENVWSFRDGAACERRHSPPRAY
jgi:hypothetical protein